MQMNTAKIAFYNLKVYRKSFVNDLGAKVNLCKRSVPLCEGGDNFKLELVGKWV